MNKLEKAVVNWWKQFRPLEFTELQHITNPLVNVPSYSADSYLAIAAVKLVIKDKQLRNKKRKKK